MKTKVCSKCKKQKLQKDFYLSRSEKDGFYSYCKSCMKTFYEANKDKILAKQKAYREANKEKLAAMREANKENKLAYQKAYYKANKEKRNAYVCSYRKKRANKDPVFYLSVICRSRINHAFKTKGFKTKGFKKKSKTADMLGCDWDFLKSYIESQFKDGMSWENRKEWHIDHIIPLASANSEDDVIKLSHFSNLQPLWADENLKKADKIIECQPELTLKH